MKIVLVYMKIMYNAKDHRSNKVVSKTDTRKTNTDVDGISESAASVPHLKCIYGSRTVEAFRILNRIEEGTYGVVYKAKDKKTGELVALKRLKIEASEQGFPINILREIKTLVLSKHPNVVNFREVVVNSNMEQVFLVMDFVKQDLKFILDRMLRHNQHFSTEAIKHLMVQLLRGLTHLHENWILHRDLKPSNLLVSDNWILKIGDFGLAREYGSPLSSYSPLVVTLWYRAPELLLGAKKYSTAIDLWSCGCIFAEMLLMSPLFPGRSELDQLDQIFRTLGLPNEKSWPAFSFLPAAQNVEFKQKYLECIIDQKFPGNVLTMTGRTLMQQFLTYDPAKRITSEEALGAKYFFRETLTLPCKAMLIKNNISNERDDYESTGKSISPFQSWQLRF